MGIEFFGDIDKDNTGKVTSQTPAWFMDIHLEYLEEDTNKKRRQVERGEIPPEHLYMINNEIKNQQGKIDDIKAGRPKLIGGQKDMIAKQYHELQNLIADSLPTRRDDRRGYVNPRDELKRAKDKHIQVKPELAEACNMKHNGGKISGDDANRMYRMMGRVLGENENVERIRKEGKSESYRSMEELTERILAKAN